MGHLVWILWVILGSLLTRHRALLRWFHIVSLIFGIVIEVGPWPCPLTLAEQWLQGKAGITPYGESFLVHYLEAVVYPDVPRGLLVWCASTVCLFNLGIYARRSWQKTARPEARPEATGCILASNREANGNSGLPVNERGIMAIEKLERHELFALLSPREIETLSSASGVVRLEEGERLYSEGVPASHFFVLLSGRVELRRPTKGGPSLLVEDLLPGSIFGVSSLTGTERYLLNSECVEDSEVLKVEGRALRHVLDQNPVVGYAIQKRVSQIFFVRYVNAMERLESIMQAMPLGRK